MKFLVRAAAVTAATCITLLAACGGDDVLGPPDGAKCTAGSVSPGDSIKSEITASSCEFWNDYDYEVNWGESWTLNAKANTAYIVRVRHVENDSAVDGIGARLRAYARNDQGDPIFATGTWYNFGPTNVNGFQHTEMFLATDVNRQFSIRIMVSDTAYAGAYTLSVESCPVRRMDGGESFTGVDVSAGCHSESYLNNGRDYRLAFFSYPGHPDSVFTTEGILTDGNGTLYPQASGPDLDIGCYTDDCLWFHPSNGVTSFSYAPTVNIEGRMTLYVGVDADSAATINVTGTVGAVAAPNPSRARSTGSRQR